MDFSLFYFAGQEKRGQDPYRLLWEGARFADRHGFTAIWTPERHFDPFGAPFPSPALTSAALSCITQNIQIRAGSVVLSLHHPIRVAEEWAMLDHFSKGRIGICFASGWHARDFVLAPEAFERKRARMLESFQCIQKLWQGESLPFLGLKLERIPLRIYPLPLRDKIPCWFAASGSPETFRVAGEQQVGILTHCLNQTVSELAEKIVLYRHCLGETGKAVCQVTLMLHTYLGRSMEAVREAAYLPLRSYLKGALQLERLRDLSVEPEEIEADPQDLEDVLDQATERYFSHCGLFGTPEHCFSFVQRLSQIGVQEIACLIDFGMEEDQVLESLWPLLELKKRCASLGDSS